MHFKKRLSIPGLIVLILLCLIPLALMGFGVNALFGRLLYGRTWLLVFLILPLITILTLCLVAFLDIRRLTKGLIIAAILVAFFFLFVFLNCLGEFELLAVYEGDTVDDVYPQLDIPTQTVFPIGEVGTPSHIQYYDYSCIQGIIFTPETETLFCQYLPQDYAAQIAFLEENYEFSTEPLTAFGYTCSPTFQLDGFTFRAIVVNDYYPKEMIFIATNDQTKQIAYLSFWNQDLDYIDDMDAFIRNDCGWKHINKELS